MEKSSYFTDLIFDHLGKKYLSKNEIFVKLANNCTQNHILQIDFTLKKLHNCSTYNFQKIFLHHAKKNVNIFNTFGDPYYVLVIWKYIKMAHYHHICYRYMN